MVCPCFPPSDCCCLQEPCLADMESLPYTSAVLKEAMRLYPPAGMTTREASSDIEVGLILDETYTASTTVQLHHVDKLAVSSSSLRQC